MRSPVHGRRLRPQPARPHRVRRHGPTVLALLAAAAAGLLAGCEETTAVTPEEYRSELAEICTDTTGALAALPTPPEQISVTDFAVDAASLLASEAEQVRRLDVPEELVDDHRALIRNTDDQAAAWRAVAESADGSDGDTDEDIAASDLTALTTRIGELQLGRDELATEMAVPECRRSTAPDG